MAEKKDLWHDFNNDSKEKNGNSGWICTYQLSFFFTPSIPTNPNKRKIQVDGSGTGAISEYVSVHPTLSQVVRLFTLAEFF